MLVKLSSLVIPLLAMVKKKEGERSFKISLGIVGYLFNIKFFFLIDNVFFSKKAKLERLKQRKRLVDLKFVIRPGIHLLLRNK